MDPVVESILKAQQRACEMTAQCADVDFIWQKRGQDDYWHATLWCNAIGDRVIGYGPDAWTAVQAAHALKAQHERLADERS